MAPKRMARAGGNRPAGGGQSRPQPRAAAPRPQRAAAPRPQRAATPQRQAAPRPQRQVAPRQQLQAAGPAAPALRQNTSPQRRERTQSTPQAKANRQQAKGRALRAIQQPAGDMTRSMGQTQRGGRQKQQRTQPAAQPAQNLSWQTSDIGKYATGGEQYGGSLGPGVFDAAAWMRARNVGGFTDEQIKDYLAKGDTGLYIGKRPQAVIENWATENPQTTQAFSGGTPGSLGRVIFNPLGETNMGIGKGGLQDKGISWYSVMGDETDWSQPGALPMQNISGKGTPYLSEADIIENQYFMKTPEGMARVFQGESPVPTRYMGNPETSQPSSEPGSVPFGYGKYTSPAASKYLQSLQYKGSWFK